MKRAPAITSVESKAAFREKLVERFVQQNLPPKVRRENKMAGMGWLADLYTEIDSCAAETAVIGTVEIFFTPKYFSIIRGISIPVRSRFFISCLRDQQGDYKVTWSSSLS